MTLATYIADDLRERIRNKNWTTERPTLYQLAEQYGVSVTPVRSAVEQLIAEGVLTRDSSRRITLTGRRPRRQGSSKKPPTRPAHFLDHFERVEEEIIGLGLRGEDIFLREEKSAQKYHVTRAAIREIFQRLAGSGILKHEPRRGWRVRLFRQEDLEAFIEVREVLELKALEKAIPYLEPPVLHRMLEANTPRQSKAAPKGDNSLHAYFIEKAGNHYISDFFARHGCYYQMLFAYEAHDREALLQSMNAHCNVLSSLLKNEYTAAKKYLSQHILENHFALERLAQSNKESTTALGPHG